MSSPTIALAFQDHIEHRLGFGYPRIPRVFKDRSIYNSQSQNPTGSLLTSKHGQNGFLSMDVNLMFGRTRYTQLSGSMLERHYSNQGASVPILRRAHIKRAIKTWAADISGGLPMIGSIVYAAVAAGG